MGHADELADIFGVPTDGSNIDTSDDISDESQEGAYAAVMKSSEENTFEEKAKSVREAVAKSSKLEDEEEEEDTNPSEEALIERTEQSKPEETKRDFETIISDAKNAAKSKSEPKQDEQMEEPETDSDETDDSEDVSGDVSEDGTVATDAFEPSEQAETVSQVDLRLKKSGFLLDSPSRMFDNFYDLKRGTLRRHLPDGKKIPIDKWTQEMHDAYVDIRINLNNKDDIADRMQSIQQKRDRVVQIKSVINSQYFLWKRLVHMVKGQLARVTYEKPKERQEGVNYEHMRDMEEYFNDLEGLFETSKDILNNLDAAYDNLSRQVTLTGVGILPEKYGRSSRRSTEESISIEDDEFDSLDDDVSVKSSFKKNTKPNKGVSGPEEISF